MSAQALYYDLSKNKWLPYVDESFASEEIERLPTVIAMDAGGQRWVWCDKHKRFETISDAKGMSMTTSEGCEIFGLPAVFSHKEFLSEEDIPVRWLVSHKDGSGIVLLSVDILKLRLFMSREPNFGITPRKVWFKYSNLTYNMSDGSSQGNLLVDFPDDILPAIFEKLRDAVSCLYGLRPAIMDNVMTGREKLKAFLYRPYDLGCYALNGYMSGIDEIPRDCKDAYYIFCARFGINPPKSLKKIYAYNPYAIPMYRTLLELGFKDYNFMLPFFEGRNIGNFDFSDSWKCGLPFLKKDKSGDTTMRYEPWVEPMNRGGAFITQEEIDALLNLGTVEMERKWFSEWEKMKGLVTMLMEAKGEKVAAHRLLAYTKSGPAQWQHDLSRMLYENRKTLPKEMLDNFIRHGFTHALHDRLVTEINRKHYGHEKIFYNDYERDLECEADGYRFELPEYTDDIAKIGQMMGNCVASYIGDVLQKRSTILSVRQGDEYVACIEVNFAIGIRQALGIRNQRLEGEVLKVVSDWRKLMLMHDEIGYTKGRKDEETGGAPAFKFRPLQGRTNFFLYSLDELIGMTPSGKSDGYYRTLATEIVTGTYHSKELKKRLIRELPEGRIRDEREFLAVRCPALKPVADAAYAGCGEAQFVLSMIYHLSGAELYVIPYDSARAQYWDMMADKNGYRGCPPLLHDI